MQDILIKVELSKEVGKILHPFLKSMDVPMTCAISNAIGLHSFFIQEQDGASRPSHCRPAYLDCNYRQIKVILLSRWQSQPTVKLMCYCPTKKFRSFLNKRITRTPNIDIRASR
jgi:hypothetical protein